MRLQFDLNKLLFVVFSLFLKKIPLAIHATNEREKNLHRSKNYVCIVIV